MTAAVVHGDFWSGNVLVRTTESGPEVTGIVDWENARRVGLPDTDLVHWWLAGQPVELGAAVRSALVTPAWASAELADLPVTLPNPQLAVEDTVLLDLARPRQRRPGPGHPDPCLSDVGGP